MQSENKQVASFILRESENVTVMHCCLHNLSILASARIQLIDHVIESHKNATSSSNCLQKKETLLKYSADIRCFDKNRKQILIEMCKTRWLEKDLADEHFYFALLFIVEALEIINDTHAPMLKWDFLKTSTQSVGIIKQSQKQCHY